MPNTWKQKAKGVRALVKFCKSLKINIVKYLYYGTDLMQRRTRE